jgi:two-component system KDP operon response regulator KdpE
MHPGRVVTQRVLEAAWPYEHDRRIDYLRILVHNLRQKLEEYPKSGTLYSDE